MSDFIDFQRHYVEKKVSMFKLFGNQARRSTKIPPKNIRELFHKAFPFAVNDEWQRNSQGYEVIFHQNEVEKIAKYNKSGQLTETRTNLTFLQIPTKIKDEAEKMGEIMNAIQIVKCNNSFYEIIYRDTALNRYVVLFDVTGAKQHHKIL